MLDKEVIEEIKQQKWKGREDKRAQQVANSFTITKRIAQIFVNKWYKTYFIITWSIIAIKEVGDRFHNNFVESLKAHLLFYKGINIRVVT
jgi:hypothetical protein